MSQTENGKREEGREIEREEWTAKMKEHTDTAIMAIMIIIKENK